MNLGHRKQERIFNDYWKKIEENIKDNENNFFINYLFFKTNSFIKNKEIYREFKECFINENNKETIAKDLLNYSNYYKQIVTYSYDKIVDNNLKNILSNEFLGYSIVISYLFDVIDKVKCEKLTIDEFKEILKLLESYLFRRFVCGIKTADLRNLFISLAKRIDDLGDGYNYYDKLVYFLNKYQFPNDVQFKEKFATFEFYKNKKNSLQIQHIFIEIEKLYSKEIVSNDLTLEHIAPQTLNKEWQQYLGNDYEIIKETWLDTIGNLTNTAYNGELSNKTFDDKKKIYEISNIKITRDICDYEKWNLESIKKRAKGITEDALKIWEYKSTTIEIKVKEEQVYLSDDTFDFTNYKPIKCFINDEEIKDVKKWNNIYKIVLNKLYNLNNDKFLEQIKMYSIFFNKDKYTRSIKITDNITFEGSFPSNRGLQFMRDFIEKFNDKNITNNNILFYVKKANK
jgi:hypothetical protein